MFSDINSHDTFREQLRQEQKARSKPVLSRCNGNSIFLFPCSKFNFSDLLVGTVNDIPHYYLDGQNANSFCEDIPKLNSLLMQVNSLSPNLPIFSIDTLDTAFVPSYYEYSAGSDCIVGVWACTEIRPTQPTPSGKAPKYSCVVWWESKNGKKSGQFFYLPNGSIGKGKFKVTCSRGEGSLSYSAQFNNGKITHIFKNASCGKIQLYKG